MADGRRLYPFIGAARREQAGEPEGTTRLRMGFPGRNPVRCDEHHDASAPPGAQAHAVLDQRIKMGQSMKPAKAFGNESNASREMRRL
jgi:hypothetical protein